MVFASLDQANYNNGLKPLPRRHHRAQHRRRPQRRNPSLGQTRDQGCHVHHEAGRRADLTALPAGAYTRLRPRISEPGALLLYNSTASNSLPCKHLPPSSTPFSRKPETGDKSATTGLDKSGPIEGRQRIVYLFGGGSPGRGEVAKEARPRRASLRTAHSTALAPRRRLPGCSLPRVHASPRLRVDRASLTPGPSPDHASHGARGRGEHDYGRPICVWRTQPVTDLPSTVPLTPTHGARTSSTLNWVPLGTRAVTASPTITPTPSSIVTTASR